MESFLPGLDSSLCQRSLTELEGKNSPVLSCYKEHGGCGLTVPKRFGGQGCSAVQLLQIQFALGSRSPSLAIAANMHNCTVCAIPRSEETENHLKLIAGEKLLVASGFADGRASTSIQTPDMKVKKTKGGFLVSGKKKPCSLGRSMDIFTASMLLEDGKDKLFSIATIPSHSEGIYIMEFGAKGFLDAAENVEIILEDVFVPSENVSTFGESFNITKELSSAFIWFEIMISASYLGVLSAMFEQICDRGRGDDASRVRALSGVRTCMLALENIAKEIDNGNLSEYNVSSSLLVRFETQKRIMECAATIIEEAGGMNFLTDPGFRYMLGVVRALAYHPPSFRSASKHIDCYELGGEFSLP
ncbi:MAG: acyl-CoA dehydrogenase family protein [Lautropia sp.]|nr:acyl-CoA dehydrogenase family protein [Lautropia sp.]